MIGVRIFQYFTVFFGITSITTCIKLTASMLPIPTTLRPSDSKLFCYSCSKGCDNPVGFLTECNKYNDSKPFCWMVQIRHLKSEAGGRERESKSKSKKPAVERRPFWPVRGCGYNNVFTFEGKEYKREENISINSCPGYKTAEIDEEGNIIMPVSRTRFVSTHKCFTCDNFDGCNRNETLCDEISKSSNIALEGEEELDEDCILQASSSESFSHNYVPFTIGTTVTFLVA